MISSNQRWKYILCYQRGKKGLFGIICNIKLIKRYHKSSSWKHSKYLHLYDKINFFKILSVVEVQKHVSYLVVRQRWLIQALMIKLIAL